LNLTISVK